MAANNTGVNTLLTDIDGKQALESSMIIPQKTMNPEQANHAEIPQNLQDIAAPIIIIAISGSELLKPFLLLLEDLNDSWLLNKRLQEVENTINIPGLR